MANGTFGGGNGSSGAPWLIEDLADLLKMASLQNTNMSPYGTGEKHYKLVNDIDVSKSALLQESRDSWNPIICYNGSGGAYISSIDFNFKAIKNLYIYKPGEDNIGFFKTFNHVANVRYIKVDLKMLI